MTQTTRKQHKRAQMLAAARRLFLAQGYARTSTDAVAREAGVSKQTLYVYFPGKAELLTAVVLQELEQLTPPGQAAAAPTSRSELRARLLALARGVTEALLQPDALALLRLLLGEAAHLPQLRGPLREALPQRLLGGVAGLLQSAQGAGLIPRADPALGARMFVGSLMSFVMLDGLLADTPASAPSEATLERLVELLLLSMEGNP